MPNNYSFNVFWSDSDQCFIATSPEFDTLSAVGDTPEEALAEMKIVLEMAMETYQEEDWSLPEPKVYTGYSGQFRVRIPKTLHAQLVSHAESEGVSLNTLVVNLLSAGMGTVRGISHFQNALDHTLQTIYTLVGTSKSPQPAQTTSFQLPVTDATVYITMGSFPVKARPLRTTHA